eukprot:4377676-Pyramimonas_sp.AAC.1
MGNLGVNAGSRGHLGAIVGLIGSSRGHLGIKSGSRGNLSSVAKPWICRVPRTHTVIDLT